MKKHFILVLLLLLLLSGCSREPVTGVAATTLPVWQFANALCEGTDISVSLVVTDNVSCLHDYSLSVNQMRFIEGCDLVIINGAGLEEAMEDALSKSKKTADASVGIPLLPGEEEFDPHIWLSVSNARQMAANICQALCEEYPDRAAALSRNLERLNGRFDALEIYAKDALSGLENRGLITFHDGFSYFAEENDLTILCAVEEESGSEASAAILSDIVRIIRENNVHAVFTEENGSAAAANALAAETGVKICTLSMGFSGNDYFETMRRNIDTVKEALQ